MMNDQHIRDEDLTAYLDDEVDDTLRTTIEQSLVTDTDLQARLSALKIDREALVEGFATLLQDAPPAPEDLFETNRTQDPDRRFGPMALVASVAFCLFLGGLTGFHLGSSSKETWQNYAATYHALYVEETLSAVSVSDADAVRALDRVQAALGRELSQETLTGIKSLDYKRAQVLGYEGSPLIQLAFLSSDRHPVALCITRASGGGDSAPVSERMLGMSAVQWSKGGYEFLLVGGTNDALLEEAANHFSRLL